MAWGSQQRPVGRVLGECSGIESHDQPKHDPSSMSQAEVTEFLIRAFYYMFSSCRQPLTASRTSVPSPQATYHRYGEVTQEINPSLDEHTTHDQNSNYLVVANQGCNSVSQLHDTNGMSCNTSEESGQPRPAREHPGYLQYQPPAALVEVCIKNGVTKPKIIDNQHAIARKGVLLLGDVMGATSTSQSKIFSNNLLEGDSVVLGDMDAEVAKVILGPRERSQTEVTAPAQPDDIVKTPVPSSDSKPSVYTPHMSYALPAQTAPSGFYAGPQFVPYPQPQYWPHPHSHTSHLDQFGQMSGQGQYNHMHVPQAYPYYTMPHMKDAHAQYFNNMHYQQGMLPYPGFGPSY